MLLGLRMALQDSCMKYGKLKSREKNCSKCPVHTCILCDNTSVTDAMLTQGHDKEIISVTHKM